MVGSRWGVLLGIGVGIVTALESAGKLRTGHDHPAQGREVKRTKGRKSSNQ